MLIFLFLLFVIGFISLFILPPLGAVLLLLCFFGLLFRIAGKDSAKEAVHAAQQAKDDSLADLRSAVKALEAKAKAEGEDSPAAAAYQQVTAELEKEEALAAERHRRKAQLATKQGWMWLRIAVLLCILAIVLAVIWQAGTFGWPPPMPWSVSW